MREARRDRSRRVQSDDEDRDRCRQGHVPGNGPPARQAAAGVLSTQCRRQRRAGFRAGRHGDHVVGRCRRYARGVQRGRADRRAHRRRGAKDARRRVEDDGGPVLHEDGPSADRRQVKIREVRAIPLAIPMREGSPRSSWTAGTSKQVLVRITTDEGLVGWGEGFAYGAPLAVANVVDEALAPLLVGEDPTRIEHLTTSMHRALMIWGRRGLGMFSVSGVELALWDLAGKARGVPVYTLLGGLAQPRLRAYASLLRYETPADV